MVLKCKNVHFQISCKSKATDPLLLLYDKVLHRGKVVKQMRYTRWCGYDGKCNWSFIWAFTRIFSVFQLLLYTCGGTTIGWRFFAWFAKTVVRFFGWQFKSVETHIQIVDTFCTVLTKSGFIYIWIYTYYIATHVFNLYENRRELQIEMTNRCDW